VKRWAKSRLSRCEKIGENLSRYACVDLAEEEAEFAKLAREERSGK
jgi:hypothetical protein